MSASNFLNISPVLNIYIKNLFITYIAIQSCLKCVKYTSVFLINRYDMNTTLRHLFGNQEMFKHSSLLSQFVNTLDLMSHRTGLPAYNYLRLDDKLRRDNIIEYDRNYSSVRYPISIWFCLLQFFFFLERIISNLIHNSMFNVQICRSILLFSHLIIVVMNRNLQCLKSVKR